MGFEVIGGDGTSIEPFARQEARQALVNEELAEGTLLPLAALVSMPAIPEEDRASIEAFYAQSWSLARYLALERRDRLAAYLAALRTSAGHLTPRASLAIFERTIGPLEETARAWHAWIRRGA